MLHAVIESFDDMGLKEDLLRGIYSYGFEKPSAIQQRAIKPLILMRDTIAQAQSGTGKTATFFQLLAAHELVVGGGARAIVTVVPSTLSQWEETAHNWLSMKHKDVCIVTTNRLKDVDEMMLRRVRVLIISRHLLAALYRQCWEWKQKHEKTEKGVWVGKWVRREGVPMHPFWLEKWDLLGVDEAYAAFNDRTTF